MSIHELELGNIKCFLDLHMRVAPLTLLTGFNSAGKSTVLQAISLLAQGLRTRRHSPNLPLNGTLVRLGTVGDVLSSNPTKGGVRIAFSNTTESIEWRFKTVGPKSGVLEIGDVTYKQGNKPPQLWSGQLWLPEVHGAESQLVGQLESLVCLSAVRGGTADVFPTPDAGALTYADVGNEGQFAPWWYAENADTEVTEERRHPDEPASNLRRQLDAYLGQLFPDAQATADEIARTSLVRLGLRVGTSSDWHRPVNVGYGLTYAFPILVVLLLAQKGQIVIIDSPEAHLHPRAQSQMGEMLSRFSKSGLQVFVETHSDHLLNGVRLAVKRKIASPSEVSVHFFGGVSGSGDHGVTSPQFDADGNIDAWPEGFFDQAERDLSELTDWG